MGGADRSAFTRLAGKKLRVDSKTLLPRWDKGQNSQSETKLPFSDLTPWESPVDGRQLLEELQALEHKHLYLSDGLALTVSLWILWTCFMQAAFIDKAPILGITGADKRVGKTRLLDLIARLVPKGLSVGRISEASLYRLIAEHHPTLLIDEFHLLLAKYPNLLDLFLLSYDRDKLVSLYNADEKKNDFFNCWSPKAVSYLGALPSPALQDRIIEVYLDRKPKGERRAKLRETPKSVTDTLLRKCLRWTADNLEAVQEIEPVILDVSNDRAGDNWEYLLAIAGLIGQDYAKRAYAFALELEQSERDAETLGPLVLKGLRDAFRKECKQENLNFAVPETKLFIPLTALCVALNRDELAPWSEWKTRKGDEGITPHRLAKIMREAYRIKPVRKRLTKSFDLLSVQSEQQKQANCYALQTLRPLFETYLEKVKSAAIPSKNPE